MARWPGTSAEFPEAVPQSTGVKVPETSGSRLLMCHEGFLVGFSDENPRRTRNSVMIATFCGVFARGKVVEDHSCRGIISGWLYGLFGWGIGGGRGPGQGETGNPGVGAVGIVGGFQVAFVEVHGHFGAGFVAHVEAGGAGRHGGH